MQTALDIVFLKPRAVKNGIVRQEINLCAGSSCFPDHRWKSFDQIYRRDSSFVTVFVKVSTALYLNGQMRG